VKLSITYPRLNGPFPGESESTGCPQFSSSNCSRRKQLGTSGTGFSWARCLSCYL